MDNVQNCYSYTFVTNLYIDLIHKYSWRQVADFRNLKSSYYTDSNSCDLDSNVPAFQCRNT
jgi:hypothetical protein